MIKALFAFVLSLSFVSTLPNTIFAHTFTSSSSVTVALHTEPDHQPRAGQFSTIQLIYSGKNQWFNLQDCICTAELQFDDKTVTKFTITTSDTKNPNMFTTNYVFNNAGMYTLQVTGQPVLAERFEPFSLSFTIAVSPPHTAGIQNKAADNQAKTRSNVLVMSAIFTIFLLLSAKLCIKRPSNT